MIDLLIVPSDMIHWRTSAIEPILNAKFLQWHPNEDIAVVKQIFRQVTKRAIRNIQKVLGTLPLPTIPWTTIDEEVRSAGVQAFVEDARLLGFLFPSVNEKTSARGRSLATVWLAKVWKNKYTYQRRLAVRKTPSSASQIAPDPSTQPREEELPSMHNIRRFVDFQPDVCE
ncbi:hypothetical protein [Absidia glauca]|uniref:Uncharacterized protein n=1 Tax=Absidia glauca TaxID=4829 RepID=A0A163JI14_ABSGL|nr:hypothetical protein [Absidia glauca]